MGVIGYAGIALYLQRGYATVSTDTGHLSSNLWWAVGHRERAIDYLYRAKHLTTVATKGLIKTYGFDYPSAVKRGQRGQAECN